MKRQEKMAIARQLAADGMVLLKNDNNTLPLAKNDEIALFGTASYRCFRMGWGSGDMLAQEISQIRDCLIEAGYKLNQNVDYVCNTWVKENMPNYAITNRNWFEWTFRFKEIEIDEKVIEESSKTSKVAVITLGRCSGESDDLKNEEGFLKLHTEEIELVKRVTKYFDKTVLLLNVCGMLDLTSIDDCKIDSIVDVSLGGEMFGYAVVDILSGEVTPSGKLAMTWAYKYEDYPTTKGVNTLAVPYNEGIYVGYRYFDTFGKDVRYPFGYGLSYTTFETKVENVYLAGSLVNIEASVTNTGKLPGREVLQCYLSSPNGMLEKAYQDLCTYAKTNTLEAGEKCTVILEFDLADMASYCEKCSSYVLERGTYYVRLGNSSRNTHVICAIDIDEKVVCTKVKNRLVPSAELELISNTGVTPISYVGEDDEKNSAPKFKLDSTSIETIECVDIEDIPVDLCKKTSKKEIVTLKDVIKGKETIDDLVAQFSDEELSMMLNGVIYEGSNANANVGSMSTKVRGAAGEMWASEKYGIPVNACADGPAGIRLSVFGSPVESDTQVAHEVVAYPSGTCLANSWDLDAARRFGECVCDDLVLSDIEGWLAPGINIQRNPLNGRNFEYLSEDPLVAGKIGAYITIGVQYDENANLTGRYTTVKHFACNNIEYERGVSDSQVSERALREIYLKAFKIAVEEGNPRAIMTAYNKINGVFASTNYDLLMGVLRGEWDYDGIVMTDWNTCAKSQEHVHAGNDLIMPGCHRKAILDGLTDGTIKREDAQLCAKRILDIMIKTNFIIEENKQNN